VSFLERVRCRDCGFEFETDRDFWLDRGLAVPRRCARCRLARRAEQITGTVDFFSGKGFGFVRGDDGVRYYVRSHAHTRAFNRAVSNLCGFGEVSAEEVERESHGEAARSSGRPQSSPSRSTPPAGSHWVSGYRFSNGWHEARLSHHDAEGGSLKVSTKKGTGALLQQAEHEGKPVTVTVTQKANTKGEAYLDTITLVEPKSQSETTEATTPLSAADIPF
jgi:hypothetical protein